MGLVKAKMSFYHDAVGTRAHNEVFEVANNQLLAQLEQSGYVEKVDAEAVQAQQQNQQLQDQVGQRQALTNEAVSLAHHVQNVEANKHNQNVAQIRRNNQGEVQQQAQQNQQQVNHEAQGQGQNKATAKKAER